MLWLVKTKECGAGPEGRFHLGSLLSVLPSHAEAFVQSLGRRWAMLASKGNQGPSLPVGGVVLGFVVGHATLIATVGRHDYDLSGAVDIRNKSHTLAIGRPNRV